jgi:hypothetical protein
MRHSLVVLLGALLIPTVAAAVPSLLVSSQGFTNNGPIPSEYTCDGRNISPPLSWSQVPATTKSIAVVVDDPDAPRGTFTHWIVTGIPPKTTSLGKQMLPTGAVAAKNDMGIAGYSGPCPPSGRHHYRFRVFALDVRLPPGLSRDELKNAMEGHVVANGQVVGTYQKQSR